MIRTLVLVGWAIVAAGFVFCEVISLADPARVAGLGEVLRRLSGSRWRLVIVFPGWMWLGWHFFAR